MLNNNSREQEAAEKKGESSEGLHHPSWSKHTLRHLHVKSWQGPFCPCPPLPPRTPSRWH